MSPLLELEGLRVRLPTPAGIRHGGRRDRLRVEPGEVFGIAGESSRKTMSVLALLGLLPPGALVEGRALFAGRDLLLACPQGAAPDLRPRARARLPGR